MLHIAAHEPIGACPAAAHLSLVPSSWPRSIVVEVAYVTEYVTE